MSVSAMQVIPITVGPLGVQCYLAACPVSREGVVIDPGGDAPAILNAIKEQKMIVTRILLTHGHGDHIGALPEIKAATGAAVLVHTDDAQGLSDPMVNMSLLFGTPIVADPPDDFLTEGDRIAVGDVVLEVLHTPGHSPGGVCFLGPDLVFTGDTLFKEGIGRADLPGASMEDLLESIQTKLLCLHDDCVIHPGHGPSSTIGHERRNNPFLHNLE